jgi:hypothetical protein
MSSAPADHAGIASAVNNDLAWFGGLLAVDVLPALAGITGSAYAGMVSTAGRPGRGCGAARADFI